MSRARITLKRELQLGPAMSPSSAVLAAFPPIIRDCSWTLLPSGGGLSGGQVWRGDLNGESLVALKRWPLSHVPGRLQLVHERMRQVAEFEFVPKLVHTLAGASLLEQDSRCWDVTTWKPGVSSFSDVSEFDTFNAIRTIGTLHRRWSSATPTNSQSVAIKSRLSLLSEWKKTRFEFAGPLREVRELTDANSVVGQQVATAADRLDNCTHFKRDWLPVHGDFWPENVLFIGHRVSAVLDFGNVHQDWPETDVARFLADLPSLDDLALQVVAEVYESTNPGVNLSVPILGALISTGRVCSLAHWMLRLNRPEPPPLHAALLRIRRLVSAIRAEIGN